MDEAPKKGNPSLSIDRAAFLILRVKKAFKKKRQQRKEKQAAQQAAATLASQTRGYKRGPPPLLRSRTLPAIVVPGISILQAQIDTNCLSTGDGTGSLSSYPPRWSLQPKSSRASLISDDSAFEFRRKSSGSTHSGPPLTNNNNAEPYIYACDDYERHPDGSVVLRIPAPHVVAARAYRMSAGSSNLSGSTGVYTQQPPQQSPAPSGSSVGCSSSSSSSTPLYRLARLLNQSIKSGRQSPTLKDDAPRRLSWERRDHINSRMPRSASIDSMVETVWNDCPRPSLDVPRNSTLQQSVSHHYMHHQQSYQLSTNFGSFSGSCSSRRESLLSPSTGRRTKQNRGIAGFNDWRNITQTLCAHKHSTEHIRAMCTYCKRKASSVNSRIDSELMKQIQSEENYWREVLKRIIATIKLLSKPGLAFRGNTNDILSDSCGNYLSCLHYLSEFDDFLKHHIKMYANCGSGRSNYLSYHTCDEFIALIDNKTREILLTQIKDAGYFAIILDSTPDVAHNDQLRHNYTT